VLLLSLLLLALSDLHETGGDDCAENQEGERSIDVGLGANGKARRTVVVEEEDVDLNIVGLSKVSLVDDLSVWVHEIQVRDL
jgi:hypothetical protein